MEIISWGTILVAIIGAVLNALKRREGFYLWMISNAGLVIINWRKGDYPQAFLFLFYFCLCLYGLYEWREK